ncbi:very short patch repair endonuclease [Rufibacter sediminis]|uniref:Very short patch repair endonuclease n=1 Tax=Rufibacter sediminis TaxID=2762756 RepID=A0ABR6VRU3_9BACT|nr:DNA mismatch endonuclease Vsr [Rufibacter sediminis]MBC3539573.1 DNA mismatch endonuclease Vsr [Rufibacter sediminis]
MADVHSKEVRSFNMSRIRGKNTKPEVLVRKFLFSKGFRYRLHDKKLPGKPDIILPKYKTVIFVHGCFWHSHDGCKYFVLPKTRTDWWANKLLTNKNKDLQNEKLLAEQGWKVLTVWECELKSKTKEETLVKIEEELWRSLNQSR